MKSTTVIIAFAAWLPACAGNSSASAPDALAHPTRPAACRSIAVGADLQAAVDAAAAGSSLCLEPGQHQGPVAIARPLTLWGPPDAVIASRGVGTTVDVTADRVELLGFSVDGSGGRFDLLDAAVRVRGANVRVEGVDIARATFGILAERSRRLLIRGNRVRGDGSVTVGMRGDSIRLWETTDSVVEDNQVFDGRDMVVWYSSRNIIRGNRIHRARYGTHLMYSSDCTVEDNRYVRVVVGVFVMYSHRVAVARNLMLRGSEMGVGIKDSGDITVTGNAIVDADMGMYLDGVPPEQEVNRIEGNAIRMCASGIVFHSSGNLIELRGNELLDNRFPVRVEGRGDARGMTWEGNYFDDYDGYDLDGDGTGDVPYEMRSLSGDLIGRYPGLAYFRGAPSLELADAVTQMVPLLEPQTILIDPRPLARPPGILEAMNAN